MLKSFLISAFLLATLSVVGQSDLDRLLKKYNEGSIPYISAEELYRDVNDYLILDTRKKEEFAVSHISGAIWVSENVDYSMYAFAKADKNKPVVVYCTVGVRSEDFGEALKKRGFTNVKNLYGSIFAWKDAGYEVVNAKNKVTDSVHVYSKEWGEYLKTGTKVY